ncbi:MAG TPA: hypothetical protein VFB69_05425 [Candidatus Dormibacteraeota bacterium]|nr:hypothetical protein [Candidatus Dormibacteraeota bacterium]
MQAFFENEVGRRLRAELDALDVRTPPMAAVRPRTGYLRAARPLAIALIAAIALAALATSVTRSPDPIRWIQPGVWMRAIGVAPPQPSPSTREDSPSPEPSPSAQPSERPEPQSPEPEPSDRPGPSTEPRESPEPASTRESPDT